MGLLKKIGAVALGAGSAVGWVAASSIKAAFKSAADKVGNGSYTAADGKSYTRQDYRDAAEKCHEDFFARGFKTAVKLWKE